MLRERFDFLVDRLIEIGIHNAQEIAEIMEGLDTLTRRWVGIINLLDDKELNNSIVLKAIRGLQDTDKDSIYGSFIFEVANNRDLKAGNPEVHLRALSKCINILKTAEDEKIEIKYIQVRQGMQAIIIHKGEDTTPEVIMYSEKIALDNSDHPNVLKHIAKRLNKHNGVFE